MGEEIIQDSWLESTFRPSVVIRCFVGYDLHEHVFVESWLDTYIMGLSLEGSWEELKEPPREFTLDPELSIFVEDGYDVDNVEELGEAKINWGDNL